MSSRPACRASLPPAPCPPFSPAQLYRRGYGFSEAPHERHFGPIHMAETMDLLMRTLGYDTFVAQGGDWGSSITIGLAKLSSLGQRPGCIAAHCNMVSAGPPPKEVMETLPPLTDWDKQGMAGGAEYQLNDSGYSKIQGTKPQSIGMALNDSPAGLLGWIVEKLRTWSDCDGDPENCFSKMDMITSANICPPLQPLDLACLLPPGGYA